MAVTVAEKTLKLINSTGPPLRVGYDGSNYLDLDVAAAGDVTLSLAGTTPEFTFSDPVNLAGTLDVTGAVTLDAALSVAGDVGVGLTTAPYAPVHVRATNAGAYAEGINLDVNDGTTGSAIGIDFNLSTADLGAVPGARISGERAGAGAAGKLVVSTRTGAGALTDALTIGSDQGITGVGAATLDTGAAGSSFGGALDVAGEITSTTGVLAIAETTTPSAVAGEGRIYTKTDNKLYFQDGAGTEHELATV